MCSRLDSPTAGSANNTPNEPGKEKSGDPHQADSFIAFYGIKIAIDQNDQDTPRALARTYSNASRVPTAGLEIASTTRAGSGAPPLLAIKSALCAHRSVLTTTGDYAPPRVYGLCCTAQSEKILLEARR